MTGRNPPAAGQEGDHLEGAGGDAPPDAELLAEAVVELEEGRWPAAPALEELVHLALCRPRVQRAQRRLLALRELAKVKAANPGASLVVLASLTARRTGEAAESIRRWEREIGRPGLGAEGPDSPSEAGEDRLQGGRT